MFNKEEKNYLRVLYGEKGKVVLIGVNTVRGLIQEGVSPWGACSAIGFGRADVRISAQPTNFFQHQQSNNKELIVESHSAMQKMAISSQGDSLSTSDTKGKGELTHPSPSLR